MLVKKVMLLYIRATRTWNTRQSALLFFGVSLFEINVLKVSSDINYMFENPSIVDSKAKINYDEKFQ